MRRVLRTSILATALISTGAIAGARDRLVAFTTDLKGLDGQFTQQVFDGRGQLKETSSGRVALSAPRLFRWEYQKPYEQLIVADGKNVWVYDPDLQQATVRPQGIEEQNSPLSALIDPNGLDRQFQVTEAGPSDGLEWLELTPREEGDASFQSARLGWGANGLDRMEIVDMVGQRTEIRFANWRRNPGFATGTFRYAPAAGVDVVGDPQ